MPWRLDAATAAKRVVRARFAAWNRADAAALQAVMHEPHVALPGPGLEIRRGEPAAPRGTGGWHHSRLERLEVRRGSDDHVYCAATFGKDADGRRYADGQMVSVVTRRADRWGILLNSVTLCPLGVGGADHAGPVAIATSLVGRWLAARDAGDAAAMRRLVHLPFVGLRGSRLTLHRAVLSLRRDAQRPSYRHEIRGLVVRERSASKVSLEVDVVRVERGGTIVGCDVALAIATELQGRWALQVWSVAEPPRPPPGRMS